MTEPLNLPYSELVKEEITDYQNQLDALKTGEITEDEFQKRRLWQGIYGQKQPNVNMIRIKFPYGLGTTEQFRKVADLGRTMTNSVLHITTRAALQLHFLQTDENTEVN